jgi:hypothetical protein
VSLRNAALWDGRRATPILRGQWVQRAAATPLPTCELLEQDYTATRHFRGLWATAFPTRDPLPLAPLSNKDGTGTQAFWDVLT